MSFTPSPQQQAIKTWVETGKGHAFVQARAGTGKSTTLRYLAKGMTGSIAIAAFNKKIAMEMSAKLEEEGVKAFSSTFHAIGLRTWKQAAPDVKIEGFGKGSSGYKKWERIAQEISIPEQFSAFAETAVNFAMQRAFGITCNIEDTHEWMQLVRHYDIESELTDETGCGNQIVAEGIEWAKRALYHNIKLGKEVISFNDMLYMPIYSNVKFWQNDWVLVDEAQDLNAARMIMARRMVKKTGRIIFVGDSAQAIYSFAGADNDAVPTIVKDFGCKEFPLTITYRCPKKIVELANRFVPDYTAADSAPDGVTLSETSEEFFKRTDLSPTDVVICRNTAPLVKAAFRLIKRGVPCHVEGREIGVGLIKLISRWKTIKSLSALQDRLEQYKEIETAKLIAKNKNAAVEFLNDRIESIFSIIDGLPSEATVSDLKTKITSMFLTTEDGKPARTLTLMTAHRSKGLEFPRVFLLGRNKYMPSTYAKQAHEIVQENNLIYVAITRAMHTFVDIIVKQGPVA